MSGVRFGNYHSGQDWGLIWIDTEIPEATPKTYEIEVPGRDGTIDLTEVLIPDVKFQNRILKFTFALIDKSQSKWQSVYSEVANCINGKKLRVVLDTDKAYYWNGRCVVSSTKEDAVHSLITVTVNAEPYKYDMATNREGAWVWDTFSFVDGVILYNRAVTGITDIVLPNKRKPVRPTIICSTSMTVSYDGHVYELVQGSNTMTDILLKEGDNVLTFRGNGTVSIRYERGSL